MSQFQWDGNTEEIYQKSISLPPAPFRAIVNRLLSDALERKVGFNALVTERDLVECIREITPKPYFRTGLRKLGPLLKESY